MKRLYSDIVDGLRFQAGRTALSMLAVGVGMTALTILLAVMGGLKEKARALIDEMGANVFVITPGERSELADSGLTLAKRSILEASLKGAQIAGIRTFEIEVSNFRKSVRVIAGDCNYFSIQDWQIHRGRMIDPMDQQTGSRVAAITRVMAEEAQWQLGQGVFLGTQVFTIVGIIDRPGTTLEKETSDLSFIPDDSTIFIPISASEQWMTSEQLQHGSLDAVQVKVQSSSQIEPVVAASQRLLTDRTGAGAFNWITPASVLENVRRLERIIGMTAGSVAFLCLILGGTTLMSLMVANVRDRITEIALRRTLGATPRDISLLFISEACVVTLTSSVIGILLACIILSLVRDQMLVPVTVSFAVLVLPLIIATLLGLFFSFLPVRLATGISPAEALRND